MPSYVTDGSFTEEVKFAEEIDINPLYYGTWEEANAGTIESVVLSDTSLEVDEWRQLTAAWWDTK